MQPLRQWWEDSKAIGGLPPKRRRQLMSGKGDPPTAHEADMAIRWARSLRSGWFVALQVLIFLLAAAAVVVAAFLILDEELSLVWPVLGAGAGLAVMTALSRRRALQLERRAIGQIAARERDSESVSR